MPSADTLAGGLMFDNRVTAADNAQVGEQIGVQFVDTVLHNTRIYTTGVGDPPERRYEVARAHLDGGNPRRAEEILNGLVGEGEFTTELAYHYVLAMLSARSYAQISAVISDEIHYTMAAARRYSRDQWKDSLEVVDMLLRNVHSDAIGSESVGEFILPAAFSSLPAARQEEIERHLKSLIDGTIQEEISRARKYRVEETRMSGKRVARAWMFFESDPRPPVLWSIDPVCDSWADWRNAFLGCVSTVLAFLWTMSRHPIGGSALGLSVVVVGGALALRYIAMQQAVMRCADTMGGKQLLRQSLPEMKYDNLIDRCLRDAGLIDPRDRARVGFREHLRFRLQHQYADDRILPGELKWLIRWHVARFADQCHNSSAPHPATDREASLRNLTIILWAMGPISMLTFGDVVGALLAAVSWLGIRGLARIASVPKARALLRRDAEQLLAEERAEYNRWVALLADRPSDAEMAHWLAWDLAFLKDEALRRADMRERELVTHVVLTERAPFTRKGRVTDGPPRYEAYMVYIFLLTQYGMRSIRTRLDLITGQIGNEQRHMCAYDAVASASVEQTSNRTLSLHGAESEQRKNRTFRLTLLNGECIAEVKERPSSPGAPTVQEDHEEELESTYPSGLDSALKVLEAVAAEGREWIDRDRERRQRWARNWCARAS